VGVRTRGLDIAVDAKRRVADAGARAEAKAIIERWNEQLAASRDMLWTPTIGAALIAGTPWLDVFCPGCGSSRAIDLRKVDRHPLASVATLVLGLRWLVVPGDGPDAKDSRATCPAACGDGLRRRTCDLECRGMMAPSRFNDPIEPMDLANMRENGVRSLGPRLQMWFSATGRPADSALTSFHGGRDCPTGADMTARPLESVSTGRSTGASAP
jgi:hypothetical protein